jgi:signal transduction histidine kinase
VKNEDGRGEKPPRGSHLGFVAHEVRNPLSTALWTAELLARMSADERGGPRGEKLAAMCQRSIARVRQLIEDHLLSERLDSGGIPLRVEKLKAREIIDAATERRAERGSFSISGDDVEVSTDRALLERIIEALVAVSGGDDVPVHVSIEADGSGIRILVTGRPPAEDALEDPVKGSPSDQKGRALALPLARRIAAALGGALTVERGGWMLSLPGAPAYTARPEPAAHP